jgi:hypothetical protein
VTQNLTNIYEYLTELHVLKTILKNTYAKTGLIKAILRVIHNLELGLPQAGTNILVIKRVSRIYNTTQQVTKIGFN